MTPIESFLILSAMLFAKHFLADGPLQTAYQLANKGRFLHPGGLAHAGAHAGLTGVCISVWGLVFAPQGLDISDLLQLTAAVILPFEFILHYLTDLAKCRVDAHFKWSTRVVGPLGERRLVIKNCDAYFVAFLTDQLLHGLTLIAIVYIITENFAPA